MTLKVLLNKRKERRKWDRERVGNIGEGEEKRGGGMVVLPQGTYPTVLE